MTFQEKLKDWTDFDGAAYELGVALSIFKDFREEGGMWLDHAPKWVFWTNNPLGNSLCEMLEEMVSVGILEKNDESQFRWVDGKVGLLTKGSKK